MFKIGDLVLILRTRELLNVNAIELRDGKTVYVCGRAGSDESRPFTEDELADPFGATSRQPTCGHASGGREYKAECSRGRADCATIRG